MNKNRYTVGELANMSGVSVRALHHFERLGLLTPARGGNGYRSYGPGDVDRLQQILLYRELGMPLKDIRAILDDPAFDPRAALVRHLGELRAKKDHIDSLIASVERTLASLEGGAPMSAEEKFEAFKRNLVQENESRYGGEVRKRWGDAAVDVANAKMVGLSREEYSQMQDIETRVREEVLAGMEDDPLGLHARAAAEAHAQWLRRTWAGGELTPAVHLSIVRGYLADERFLAYYDAWAAGAGRFLVSAVEKYYA